jgi:CHAT domain-containing protein
MKQQRSKGDEFLRFADSYLREAFPNPSRQGCPEDRELQRLAEKPTQADLSLTEHISCCSPCYIRYAALLAQQKAGFDAEHPLEHYWYANRSRILWATAVTVLLACVAVLLIVTRPASQPTYQALKVDLSGVSPGRGANQNPPREIQVPQRLLDLIIQLPIGSEEGSYQVSLRSGPSVVWSQVAQAHLTDHIVQLETRADFRSFRVGKYELIIESATGLRFVQPIQVSTPKHIGAAGSRWREKILASVGSHLISIHLPGRSRAIPTHEGKGRGDAARELTAEADRFAWLGNSAAAAPLYAKVELLASQAGDVKATIHARVGRIRSQAESMPFAQVSEMLATELENPVVQHDPKLRLFCLAAKGYTDLDVNLASCRRAWEQALQTARELHDQAWESRVSGELGIVAYLEGDTASAEELVGAALLSAMKNGDVTAQIRFLSMIGNGFADLKRYDDASEFFGRAIKLAGETKDVGFPFMAYEGEARCLIALGKTTDGQRLLENGLEQARKENKRDHQAEMLILLGELSLADNNVGKAENYLQNAAELSRTSQFPRMESEAMYELATIYRQQGKLPETEYCLRRGIDASRAVGDAYYLPRDLSGLAEIKALSGHPKEADALWDQATDVLEGILIHAPSSYARSTMIAAMSDIYLRHFELAAKQDNVQKAFQIVERARGRSVVDLLWQQTSDRVESPDATTAERQISSLQVELIRAHRRQERRALLEDLFETEQKWALAATGSAKSYAVRRPVALSKMQQSLLPRELLLEYVLSDPDSYCLAITRASAQVVSLEASRGRIGLLVHDYLGLVRSRKPASDVGRQLYTILLGRINRVRTSSRIVVIPDGILHLLPFDALQGPHGNYLLESSVVSYAPSATVLQLLRTHKRTAATLPFLGVGDVDYSPGPFTASAVAPNSNDVTRGIYDLSGAHFAPLPGTRAELLGASQVLGPESVVLLGRQATETAFKHEPLAKFRVLHLAVHGIASARFPERAALILGRDPISQDDGLLQTREIADLALNADLVTLSACDTGVGRLQGEEGIASLQRAFMLAGARATISTLWSADDTFTAALIKQFYENLSHGMDKGEALRKAKLDLLRKFGGQALPYYWAGFVLDGESTSPVFSRP